ncbi:MAG: MCE family protein, partial [Alphaproteobacteria bacterium]|nr:MCE family protein [Alphaproteobacteria bacterium]
METKAHHVLIGAFVLAGLAMGAVFAVWLSRLQLDQQWDRYRIYFFGSVTGLSKTSEVRYNGVPVGSVTDIQIDPADPRRVLVLIEVRAGTPVKEDSTAALELQGITGIAYVAIAGGSAASPPLRQIHAGGGLPVIPSKASGIQEVIATAPELLNRAMTLLAEGAKVISEDNIRAIARILANVERASGTTAERSGSLIEELERTSAEFRRAAGSAAKALDQVGGEASEALAGLRGTAGKVDRLVESDLRGLIGEARGTTAA